MPPRRVGSGSRQLTLFAHRVSDSGPRDPSSGKVAVPLLPRRVGPGINDRNWNPPGRQVHTQSVPSRTRVVVGREDRREDGTFTPPVEMVSLDGGPGSWGDALNLSQKDRNIFYTPTQECEPTLGLRGPFDNFP